MYIVGTAYVLMENYRKLSFNYHQIPSLTILPPLFSDRQVCAKSLDPDQTAPTGALGAVF